VSNKAKSILEAALALPVKDRGMLAGRLFESLPPPPSFEGLNKRQFTAELRRRNREMEAGIDAGIPWSQVKTMQ
jgi:putative addiction module component (TIGR02574 family)